MALELKGIAFPFQIGITDFPKVCTDEDLIKQSLIQILMVSKEERYMRPDFGCNSLEFVFEPSQDYLLARIRRDVNQAISKNERRVLVQDVNVVQSADEKNDVEAALIVTIYYIILTTGVADNLSVSLG